MPEYNFSFGKFIKHSESLVEVIIYEGVDLDQSHADEINSFFQREMSQHFGVLSNMVNNHSYKFNGALKVGNSPLQKKAALLVYSKVAEKNMELVKGIQKISHPGKEIRIFTKRKEALAWLKEIV